MNTRQTVFIPGPLEQQLNNPAYAAARKAESAAMRAQRVESLNCINEGRYSSFSKHLSVRLLGLIKRVGSYLARLSRGLR